MKVEIFLEWKNNKHDAWLQCPETHGNYYSRLVYRLVEFKFFLLVEFFIFYHRTQK